MTATAPLPAVPAAPPGYKRPSNVRLIETLRTARGVVAIAAHVLGVHRTTVRDWINADDEMKAALQDIRDTNLDLAEAKALTKALDEGHPDILRFYLRCFGRERGWVETTRIEGTNGGPVQVEQVSRVPAELEGINPANYTDVELVEFSRLMRMAAVDLSHEELDRLKKLRQKGAAPTIDAVRAEAPANE